MKHFAIIISLLSFFTLCRAQENSKYLSFDASYQCEFYYEPVSCAEVSLKYTFYSKKHFDQFAGLTALTIGHEKAQVEGLLSYGARYKFREDLFNGGYQPFVQAEYGLMTDENEAMRFAVGVFKNHNGNKWSVSFGTHIDTRDVFNLSFTLGYYFKINKKHKEGGN